MRDMMVPMLLPAHEILCWYAAKAAVSAEIDELYALDLATPANRPMRLVGTFLKKLMGDVDEPQLPRWNALTCLERSTGKGRYQARQLLDLAGGIVDDGVGKAIAELYADGVLALAEAAVEAERVADGFEPNPTLDTGRAHDRAANTLHERLCETRVDPEEEFIAGYRATFVLQSGDQGDGGNHVDIRLQEDGALLASVTCGSIGDTTAVNNHPDIVRVTPAGPRKTLLEFAGRLSFSVRSKLPVQIMRICTGTAVVVETIESVAEEPA